MILAVGLAVALAAAPDAGAARRAPLPFVWELPPRTLNEIPIDGVTWVDGIPVRLRQLNVAGTPEQIGRHFLASFQKQDLYVAPRQAIDRLLTAVDPESLITYSVVLQPNVPGRTTVVLGEARLLDRKKPADDGLPVLPQAKGAIPVQTEGARVLSYSATATLTDAEAFYARELTARGWRMGQEPGVWRRGPSNDRLELEISAQGPKVQVVVKQWLGATK